MRVRSLVTRHGANSRPWATYSPSRSDVYIWRRTHTRRVGVLIETPTNLLPGNLDLFRRRIQPPLLEHAYGVFTFGAKPRAICHAIRSRQDPYSSVADNPQRTAADLRGDLVKGLVMVFTRESDSFVGRIDGVETLICNTTRSLK